MAFGGWLLPVVLGQTESHKLEEVGRGPRWLPHIPFEDENENDDEEEECLGEIFAMCPRGAGYTREHGQIA